jgi:uncharacterized protein (DUF362 family)
MNTHINRREFVKKCTVAGVGLVTAPSLTHALETLVPGEKHTICAVVGDTYFDNTRKAVDGLGGIKKFVKKGGSVGILINSPFGHLGTMTNPDISLAVVRMCLDAGAKKICTIHETSPRYWRQGTFYEKMKSDIDAVGYSGEMKEVAIDKGKTLKKAEISQTLVSCDTYINIPIIKDHEGTRFTCNMKNVMGACASSTCRFFHYGGKFSLFSGAYSNAELLSQCIADVQLVRQPDLCVVDATEILATNGPAGPGDLKKPREIIAATNCVAADMYAVRHLGLNPDDLPVFRFAHEHGIGPVSLKDVTIKTI